MKIIEMNEGTKIDYQLTKTKLDFADGALRIDLARYQRDEVVVKDIMVDNEGCLTTGNGRYYAAQVEIPAIEYNETATMETVTDENGEETEREVINKERLPLDTDKVTLRLFSIDGIIIY